MDRYFLKNVDAQNLQNPTEVFTKSMHLIETGHHEVDANGDPDLGLHRVLGGSVERLDSEVLLDPLEEQLDMPTTLIDMGDYNGWQTEMVGDKDKTFARCGIDETDATEFTGIVPLALGGLQSDALVATQSTGFIDGTGLAHVESHVALGSCNEESTGLMNAIQASEINVSTVHDIDASRFESDPVKNVHIMNASIGYVHEHWDGASQVDHRMQFDRSFGLSEMSPRKHRKAQVDGRSIECVNDLIEIESIRVFGIQSAGFADKCLPDSFVNAPITILIRIGEIGSNDVSPDAHRMAMSATIQTRLDIAQALPESYLGENHGEKLVAGAHALAGSWHRVQSHAAVELLAMDHIGNLGEDEASGVHPLLRMNSASNGQSVQMRHMPFYALNARNEEVTKS